MYTPEINFLKERTLTATTGQFTSGGVGTPVAPSRGGSTAIIVGLLIAGVSLGAYAWGNFQLTSRLTALRLDRDEINRELSEAQAELSRRQALQTELDGLLARTSAFQSFFVSLQPWSAILQDVRNRVPPDVWVSNLSTTANTVTIQGQSLEFEQVNDFILTLKQSPYVETVQLNNTQEVAGTEDTLPSVNYGLTVTLANLQLSTPETLDILRAQGALGVVEKLTILRELEID